MTSDRSNAGSRGQGAGKGVREEGTRGEGGHPESPPHSRTPALPSSPPEAALFPRLCAVGNALEALRDARFPQGALWLQLDDVLTALDAVIDTLASPLADGGSARQAARAGEGEEEDDAC